MGVLPTEVVHLEYETEYLIPGIVNREYSGDDIVDIDFRVLPKWESFVFLNLQVEDHWKEYFASKFGVLDSENGYDSYLDLAMRMWRYIIDDTKQRWAHTRECSDNTDFFLFCLWEIVSMLKSGEELHANARCMYEHFTPFTLVTLDEILGAK